MQSIQASFEKRQKLSHEEYNRIKELAHKAINIHVYIYEYEH